MIGIGITTYNRFKIAEYTLKKFISYLPADCQLFMIDDHSDEGEYVEFIKKFPNVSITRNEKRLGIAKSKNRILDEFNGRKFEGVIAFDDDCFPIEPNWHLPFLKAWEHHGQHHLIYACNKAQQQVRQFEHATLWDGCLGVSIWMSRYAIETTKGWDNRFEMYGYEHAELTARCFKSNLSPLGPYVSPNFITDYLYCLDAYGHYKDETQKVWFAKTSIDNKEDHLRINSDVVRKHGLLA